jgi:hypothetical protein
MQMDVKGSLPAVKDSLEHRPDGGRVNSRTDPAIRYVVVIINREVSAWQYEESPFPDAPDPHRQESDSLVSVAVWALKVAPDVLIESSCQSHLNLHCRALK